MMTEIIDFGFTARLWHNMRLQWSDVAAATYYQPLQCKEHVVELEMPKHFPGRVVLKFVNHFYREASSPQNEGIVVESSVYSRIHSAAIGPKFLGHLMEGDRCVGFFLDKIEGRPAVLADDAACSQLSKALYELGIVHRDLHSENFIVNNDRAYLIDFETCVDRKDWPHELMEIMY